MDQKRVFLSGAAKRRRALEQNEQSSKCSEYMAKWLKTGKPAEEKEERDDEGRSSNEEADGNYNVSNLSIDVVVPVENTPQCTENPAIQSSPADTAVLSPSVEDMSERSVNTRQGKKSAIPNLLSIEMKIQPSKSFVFPQTHGRRVQHEWFEKYDWLHYDTMGDSLLCHTCVRACHLVDKRDSSWFKDVELAFLVVGFKNWKKATDRLAAHQKSHFHKKCVELILRREHAVPVTAQIQEAHQSEQRDARTALLIIISSLRFLARSGNATRGHESDGGNLMMLLEERSLDSPILKRWLQRRDNYMSPQIQNEILEIMAHMILRNLVSEIKISPWFSIIADGTTDCTGMEQFSLCVRFVHPQTMVIREEFLGMYNPVDSKGHTLAAAVKDMLLRLSLSIADLRGHCFDGAANMSGHEKGVRRIIADEQPKSLYVHCSNHAADLALQEVARETRGMCDLLCLVKDSSNCILESAKRKTMYENVVLPACTVSSEPSLVNLKHLIPLCPTRWCVRVKSLKRFKQQYERVQMTLQEIVDEKSGISDERRSAVRGWLSKLNKFETMLFLTFSIEILGPCEQLARALQSPSLSATGAMQAAALVISQLESLRSSEHFDRMYNETINLAEDLELDHPMETRTRKTPRRLEDTSNPAPSVRLQPKDRLRMEYYEMLDLLTTALKHRFEQETLRTLSLLEALLLDALGGKVPNEEGIKEVLGPLTEDFDIDSLHTQLQILKNLPGETPLSCSGLAEKLSKESDTTKALVQQVMLLLNLILTIPASAASSERSFSALRRLKTYLRSTMTQKRLTHVVLLHVHKDVTAALDLKSVMREFVSRNEERKRIFGKV